jgi:hypothetical protein
LDKKKRLKMVDTSGLQKKLQASEAKSRIFEAKKRASFGGARFYGVVGAFLLAVDLVDLNLHDEEAYLKVKADYEAGQLVIPDSYIDEKVIDCVEDVYEDEFEEEQGVDYDDLDGDQLVELVGKNRAAFARCNGDLLAQSDEVQKKYVDKQGFHWNFALFVWGGIGGFYTLGGLNSWNRQRKYGNEAKSKAQELKLFD